MQMEFDRITVGQDANFLAVKLQWLEVVPRIITLAEAEKANSHIRDLLEQSVEHSDEG